MIQARGGVGQGCIFESDERQIVAVSLEYVGFQRIGETTPRSLSPRGSSVFSNDALASRERGRGGGGDVRTRRKLIFDPGSIIPGETNRSFRMESYPIRRLPLILARVFSIARTGRSVFLLEIHTLYDRSHCFYDYTLFYTR